MLWHFWSINSLSLIWHTVSFVINTPQFWNQSVDKMTKNDSKCVQQVSISVLIYKHDSNFCYLKKKTNNNNNNNKNNVYFIHFFFFFASKLTFLGYFGTENFTSILNAPLLENLTPGWRGGGFYYYQYGMAFPSSMQLI